MTNGSTASVQENGVSPAPGELEAIARAYQVMLARDGTAERRAWHWQCLTYILVIAFIGLGVWDHVDRRVRVEPFIQQVQVTEEGVVEKLGLPTTLLAYEPQDGQWRDMLAAWVQKTRWRGVDATVAQRDWSWAYIHTCGHATKMLREDEVQEKPFTLGKKTVSIDIKSITRASDPAIAYQVLWEETIIEDARQPYRQMWTGAFTVGRTVPQSRADLLQNSLGLCVTAYDLAAQPR